MKTSELVIKDQSGNEVEKVIYDKDTLIIQDVLVLSEHLQDFVPVRLMSYKNMYQLKWLELEVKIANHHYEMLVGRADKIESHIREAAGVA